MPELLKFTFFSTISDGWLVPSYNKTLPTIGNWKDQLTSILMPGTSNTFCFSLVFQGWYLQQTTYSASHSKCLHRDTPVKLHFIFVPLETVETVLEAVSVFALQHCCVSSLNRVGHSNSFKMKAKHSYADKIELVLYLNTHLYNCMWKLI